MRRSSAYVDHMVKNLLLLIKAQGDAPNAQSAVLDVREQVEVAVNELLPQARQRGITVSITGKGEPKVRGNATAIRAAIGKLVDNAIEYSPDNANVSVLIETTRDTKVRWCAWWTAERESRSRSSRASSNGSTAERTRTSARSRRRPRPGHRQACGHHAPRQCAGVEQTWAGQHIQSGATARARVCRGGRRNQSAPSRR